MDSVTSDTVDSPQTNKPAAKKTPFLKLFIIAFALAPVAVLMMFITFGDILKPLPPESEYPTLGGDFTLQSANGDVSLNDYFGKVVVISFGYTNCPDICPLTMKKITSAFESMSSEELAKTQGLFITMDPERDKVAEVSEFTKYFHSNFVGLTGSLDEITKISKSYSAAFMKEPGVKEEGKSENEYTLTHSSYVYVIRPDGLVGNLIRYSATADDIGVAIRQWLPWANEPEKPVEG